MALFIRLGNVISATLSIVLALATSQVRFYQYNRSSILSNPLATYDNYSCHQNLAARYQLVQSALKIGSALAERVGQGEVGGCHPLGAWWLLQLAAKNPGGHFSAGVFSGWRALNIEHLAMNGCGQKNIVAQVSRANFWLKWKYR